MLAADTLATVGSQPTPQDGAARHLIVTWQHPTTRSISPVGRLDFDGVTYSFSYIRNALTVDNFRPLLGFPDLRQRYASDSLFPLFAQRAMDPRRPDYVRYVHRLGLEADTSPWEQITRSGGRREGDALQLMPVPTTVDGRLTALFLANGVRHMVDNDQMVGETVVRLSRDQLEATLDALHVGDSLRLVTQPTNQANSRAVLITTMDDTPVGFVPNLLLDDLHAVSELSPLEVRVAVVNGPDAPWHLRLLVRLTAPGAGDYRFFAGDNWEPLSDSADAQ
jgi:hypothetical protein